MAAWVIRGGRRGEQEAANLTDGKATIGWAECGNLTACITRDEIRALVDRAYPNDQLQRRAVNTGQLWAFRHSIQPGDLIIMPLKTKPGYLAMGRCTGPYAYDSSATDEERRNTVPVTWLDEPVSKTGIKDDLLNTLNSIMTVFQPSRNNAAQRLEEVYKEGIDPGNTPVLSASIKQPTNASAASPDATDVTVTDPDPAPTLDAIKDRIRTHLVENFAGHKLTGLVAEILTALGFVCDVSPTGPDGGVDIVAGTGPLGLDSPTVIVEVKSEPTAVGSSVVRGLHSAMTQHQADQALLVAWGGVTSPARREFATQRTKLRIWESEDLLQRLFDTYDRLPIATRENIPLARAWVLDEEGD